MKDVVYSAGARRALRGLPSEVRQRIVGKLERYARTGAGDVKAMSGSDLLRLRSGDYRALFAEDATRIATGLLAEQRARPNRVLRMIEAPGSPPALAVFDQVFPGAYPLRAPAPPHVLSLLRALRPHARLEDTFINLMIEDQADIAEALLAEGAQLRMEALHMRGPT